MSFFVNEYEFRDHYSFYRDVICPDTNGYEFFMYFFYNRFKKVSSCNPWVRNIAKLIFPKVFIDVDLVKGIMKTYNLATRSFYKYNGSILCMLERPSFIEAFGLERKMSEQIDVEDL